MTAAPAPSQFDDPWQAQIFALTVALSDAGHFSWHDWTVAFGATLKRHRAERALDEVFAEMGGGETPHPVDLVVMGSHGARGFRGVVGSNTQKVVRIAPMPVLVIKHQIDDFTVNDLVYASNFTETDIMKFDAFLPVLEIFDPKVHLVKVNTPKAFERSEDTYKAIDRFLQRHELRKFTSTIYNDLSIEEGILNFARGIDADMIAMATHGRTGFFQVVNGSLTEDIVNHTTFPVLSVKL